MGESRRLAGLILEELVQQLLDSVGAPAAWERGSVRFVIGVPALVRSWGEAGLAAAADPRAACSRFGRLIR